MPEPPRYFVNVTSHILRYRSLGVDARAVLVVRDPALHFAGVLKNHCKDHSVALKQYATGRRILEEALAAVDPVVVSYEALMTLGDGYWKDVLGKLDVGSGRAPAFVNGNLKYQGDVGVPVSIRTYLSGEGPREDVASFGPSHSREVADEEGPQRQISATAPSVGHDGANSDANRPENEPSEGDLPKRLIAVFGLESSGTTFVWSALNEALGATREGNEEGRNAEGAIYTQHVSLPSGKNPAHRQEQEAVVRTIVPAYLPGPCQFRASFDDYDEEAVRSRPAPAHCRPYGPYLMPKPPRYFLNVTSHIQHYRDLGVDARAVLVVRDPAMHFVGVLENHCEDETMAVEQYAVGRRIMEEALAAIDPVVVSYETLMTLRGAYWKDILRKLDVDSSHVPEFVNGNLKYEGNVGVHKMVIGGLRFEHNREKRWRKPRAAG
ncbi:hypothetical protein ACHAWF_014816 [Thalassiosira exigua]